MYAEMGIYEAYVIADRAIGDYTVTKAVETLIRGLRSGAISVEVDSTEIIYDREQPDDLVINCIRRNWTRRFATKSWPGKDDLIGILRTILASIQVHRLPGRESQGYLQFMVKFMTKDLGVSIRRIQSDENNSELQSIIEDQLLRLGRQWYRDGNREARAEFFEQAAQFTKSGQGEQVTRACQLLMTEAADPNSDFTLELTHWVEQNTPSSDTLKLTT
jgi:hypothetical protein